MARRNATVWAICFLFTALSFPRSAAADTIRVTSGFLFVQGGSGGPVELVGERGFSLMSGVSVAGGRFLPWEQCSVPECDPGTVVSLRALWTGNDLTGTLTFEGRTYDDMGGPVAFAQASIEFLGSFVAPPLAPTAMLASPFRLAGSFSIPNATATDEIRHQLTGTGTATIRLSQRFAFDPAWWVDSVRYDFSAADPVPEPGTMLLVGLGIAGVARRVRLNRDRTRAGAR